jgi:hypothetical protein
VTVASRITEINAEIKTIKSIIQKKMDKIIKIDKKNFRKKNGNQFSRNLKKNQKLQKKIRKIKIL